MTLKPVPQCLALDLGSTRVKAGIFHARAGWLQTESLPAPHLLRRGLLVEGDATRYLETVLEVLTALPEASKNLPLTLACQRSSFLIWRRASGQPVTPLISWEDRRPAALPWPGTPLSPSLESRTGLRASPHYLGPKLSRLLREDPALKRGITQGRLAWGTLDSYLCFVLGQRSPWIMETTLASRTLLASGRSGKWSRPLFESFKIPWSHRPRLLSSRHPPIQWSTGHQLVCQAADQTTALFGTVGNRRTVTINLGTGGFVLQILPNTFKQAAPYLVAPYFPIGNRRTYHREATLNGISRFPHLDRLPRIILDETDPLPQGFCIPDRSGMGSPYWIPEGYPEGSPDYLKAAPLLQTRIWLEGLGFRLRQILEDWCIPSSQTVTVSGGLSRAEPVIPFLAAILNRPLVQVLDPETTLLGAACLALGKTPQAYLESRAVPPGAHAASFAVKYQAWRIWMRQVTVLWGGDSPLHDSGIDKNP